MAKVIIGSKENPKSVRFSYANVFVPKAMADGQAEKYSVAILIDKSDTELVEKIKRGIKEAYEEGVAAKWQGKKPIKGSWKSPLRDGDEKGDDVYAGHYFINANSINKPGIVDENREEIMSNDEFYSGCYGRASVNFYPFNNSGNKGVACGLNNLQKLEDGERLSGGSSAFDDFGDDDDDIL